MKRICKDVAECDDCDHQCIDEHDHLFCKHSNREIPEDNVTIPAWCKQPDAPPSRKPPATPDQLLGARHDIADEDEPVKRIPKKRIQKYHVPTEPGWYEHEINSGNKRKVLIKGSSGLLFAVASDLGKFTFKIPIDQLYGRFGPSVEPPEGWNDDDA